MLARLLPAPIRVAEQVGEPGGGMLLPAEAADLGPAGPRRRQEFTQSRTCARRALAGLRLPVVPLLRDPEGAPRWPDGVVGSLTHCPGYVGAAVGRRADVRSLGVDAEPHRPLPYGVLPRVAGVGERAHLAALPAGTAWETVLFSAKESVYKAWYPIMRGYLTFSAAVLTIDPAGGRFTARLTAPGPPVLHGRFLVTTRLILTAVTVPCVPAARTGQP